MSKKQTRRSISVSGDLYDRLKAYCDEHQLSLSGVVETQLRQHLGLEVAEPRAKQSSKRWDGPRVAPSPAVASPPGRAPLGMSPAEVAAREDRLVSIKQVAAEKAEPIKVTKTVTVTTPVLEKNGNWEKKPADGEKRQGTNLDDLASKIFTF
jgi:hypothetical protein